MKRLSIGIICLIIIGLIMPVTACQNNSSPGAEGTNSLNVAVFYYNFSDAFLTEYREILDENLKTMGVEYTNYDSGSDQATQLEQVEEAIENGADFLIVNIVDISPADGAHAIVEQARNADIPVIFFNREIDDSVVNSYDKCVFVGGVPRESGPMQGKMIAGFLLAGDNYSETDLNGDGVISYVMFKGMEGSIEADSRTVHSVDECNRLLEADGKPPLQFYDESNSERYLVDPDGNWSREASYNYMIGIMNEYNESNGNMIELVIANNDDMAWGAVSALQEFGYNHDDSAGTIPVFGVDAMDFAQQLIREGKMTGTVRHDLQGMVTAVCVVAGNIVGGRDMMEGTSVYNVDEHVAKIRISFGIVTRGNTTQ